MNQYLFVDFEFTMPAGKKRQQPCRKNGNNRFFAEIIEVGIVSVIGGQIYDTFSSYVRPEHFPVLSERCKTFLGISQDAVDDGISFSQLVETFDAYIQLAPTTVVTWGDGDMIVLRRNCYRANLPFPNPFRTLDLADEYRRFFGDRNLTSLRNAIRDYGQNGTGQQHKALDDALTTYEVFKRFEKDKRYLQPPKKTTIADRFDFAAILERFA